MFDSTRNSSVHPSVSALTSSEESLIRRTKDLPTRLFDDEDIVYAFIHVVWAKSRIWETGLAQFGQSLRG